jgi:hypothetical protein
VSSNGLRCGRLGLEMHLEDAATLGRLARRPGFLGQRSHGRPGRGFGPRSLRSGAGPPCAWRTFPGPCACRPAPPQGQRKETEAQAQGLSPRFDRVIEGRKMRAAQSSAAVLGRGETHDPNLSAHGVRVGFPGVVKSVRAGSGSHRSEGEPAALSELRCFNPAHPVSNG